MILDESQILIALLKKKFQSAQQKNNKFSLRAFATKLGISSSSLSEILNGKRVVSKKKALSIVSKLDVSEREKSQVVAAFEKGRKLELLKRKPNHRNEIIIDEPEFDLMADWRYFGFMALTRTSDFQSDAKWIAKRLGLSIEEVREIIDRLHHLKIISKDVRGNITDNNACYRTPEDFPAALIRARQINGLKTVVKLLENEDPRQFGCFSTITTDVKKFAEAKLMTEDFLKRLSLFLCDSTDRTEVFELQIQLFPRSKT